MKLLLVFLPFVLFGQTHSVTLNWRDSVNPTGTVWNVYRGSGACVPGTPLTNKLTATPLTVMTLTDSGVAGTGLSPGTYCYAVTATAPAASESPQVTAPAVVPNPPSAAVSALTVIVNP